MPRRGQADNKTQPRAGSVEDYIAGLSHVGRREDAQQLLALMQHITGESPVLWGPSIIGFGQYHYQYDSGREGDSFLTGFAPRKANMVIYIMPGFADYANLLDKLGRHKVSRSCLYLGRLKGVDMDVLGELVTQSVDEMRRRYL